MRELTTGSWD